MPTFEWPYPLLLCPQSRYTDQIWLVYYVVPIPHLWKLSCILGHWRQQPGHRPKFRTVMAIGWQLWYIMITTRVILTSISACYGAYSSWLNHCKLSHTHSTIVHTHDAETIQGWGLFHSAPARELVQEQFKGGKNSRKYINLTQKPYSQTLTQPTL